MSEEGLKALFGVPQVVEIIKKCVDKTVIYSISMKIEVALTA